MIHLFLAILSSASIALILKFSENRNLNRYAVTSANYVAAFTISLVLAVSEGPLVVEPGDGFFRTAVLGIGGGVLYFFGFIWIQKSIKENGVGITGAVAKIGIIVPVVLSMILWKEIPTAAQAVGVVISFLAILLVNISFDDLNVGKKINSTILLVFFIVGFAEFSNKIFEVYGQPELKPWYLFVLFFTAFWISLYVTIVKRQRGGLIGKADIATGLLVGIPNMLTSYFLIESFKTYKASIAFPIYGSGSILLISIGGLILFREKMKKREMIAVAMIIAAIMLMKNG